ncbi:MAG: helix-turn-helix transcriptional regulator [Spirochaetaceae bacterium]|nr:helix-turn-helix transcriptional regulator [Spirochaetaceae bacterium]
MRLVIYYNFSMNKVKAARLMLELKQEDLAQKVGVTRQTIGLIESGCYNPTLNLCIKIAKELHKTLDELFWEESYNE